MYAKINGVDLFFDIEGKKYVPDGSVMRKKPVCFILHGGPGVSHYHFLPAFSALADSMQLVFIDHRCCGLSGKAPIETCSMEQNADDAEALRQYLGLDKIFLLGMSYGGMVAQKYALKYQEHLQGLILCCTAPNYRYFETSPGVVRRRGTPEQIEFGKKMNEKGLIKTDEEMRKLFKLFGSLYHYHYDKAACDAAVDRAIYSPEVIAYQRGPAGEMRRFDFLPELHKIKVPTLILAASEDHAIPPEHSVEIANEIKHAELTIIPEAGHEIGDDRPDVTFPLIRDFVARNAE
jgi:proline iminopeptidase